jgi:hypothetical protein
MAGFFPTVVLSEAKDLTKAIDYTMESRCAFEFVRDASPSARRGMTMRFSVASIAEC